MGCKFFIRSPASTREESNSLHKDTFCTLKTEPWAEFELEPKRPERAIRDFVLKYASLPAYPDCNVYHHTFSEERDVDIVTGSLVSRFIDDTGLKHRLTFSSRGELSDDELEKERKKGNPDRKFTIKLRNVHPDGVLSFVELANGVNLTLARSVLENKDFWRHVFVDFLRDRYCTNSFAALTGEHLFDVPTVCDGNYC